MTKSLDERSQELAEKLKSVRDRAEKQNTTSFSAETGKGYAQAMRYTSDFVSGPIVGAILGYVIDKLFNFTPWGLIILLIFGFGAGVLNVYKTSLRETALYKVSQEEKKI